MWYTQAYERVMRTPLELLRTMILYLDIYYKCAVSFWIHLLLYLS